MLFAKPIKKAHFRSDYSDFESHQCNLESEHIQFVITSVLTEKCMLRKQWLSSKKKYYIPSWDHKRSYFKISFSKLQLASDLITKLQSALLV